MSKTATIRIGNDIHKKLSLFKYETESKSLGEAINLLLKKSEEQNE